MNDPSDSSGAHAAHGTRSEWMDHHREGRRATLPRALRLTALSAVVPGAGLLRTRAKVLGMALLGALLVGALALGYAVWRKGLTSTALGTAASPERLKLILAVLIIGTFIWIAAIATTALLTRPARTTRKQRVTLAAFTGVLCLAVSAPAALGYEYITSHLSAMDKVFNQPMASPNGSEPTSSLSKDPKDPWADLPRVNILLLGSDADKGREGTRTDTMIVASIDTHTGESVLFSIPRNLQRVPIPRDNPLYKTYGGVYDCGNQCLMNAIWTAADLNAQEHPAWYVGETNPGLSATREVLSTILGLPIQHTVIVNLKGFEELIDAMGGVSITVQEPIPINGRTYTDAAGHLQLDPNSPGLEWLEPGTQELTGHQALGYSRSRVTTDDFSRMRRQRCMVAAVIDQADPLTLLQRYPQIITAVGNNVVTDIPSTELSTWAELVMLVQKSKIKSLPFTPKNTDVTDPDYSQIRYLVWEAIHPADAPPTSEQPADDAAATSTAPSGTSTSSSSQDDSSATTTETDELADIGAVCG
ncbi:MAG: LCP family protein [Ornithinimicrobium sp.]|uniref:LCP family protein n=1 Tax=Ornithinimicrobium sp. TaxID=1977084 RepID=UPI0026E01D22|nr:LCP family protein [Ornithinimicrobium sp.]MDO5741237.1 LCP family protein [Ornithinimicrobium sp.]